MLAKRCPRCQTEKATSEFSLSIGRFDGHQSTCKGCMRDYKRDLRRRNPAWAMWERYSNGGPRKLEFSLSRGLVEDLVSDFCFYCGAEPDPVNGIDRVDNEAGYIEGNVVTACGICNQAKHTLSRQKFEAWIIMAAKHISDRERRAA